MSEIYRSAYYSRMTGAPFAARELNRSTCIIYKESDTHVKMGAYDLLICGTPGSTKGDMKYTPIMWLRVPNAFTAAQVSWAKLWLYAYNIIGTPQNNSFYRCARPGYPSTSPPYDYNASDFWRDYFVDEKYFGNSGDELDQTCYQHNEGAWATPGGDFAGTPSPVVFAGPSAVGWFSITITDHVKWALTNFNGYVNFILGPGIAASTAFYFYGPQNSYGTRIPYIEVEWTGGQRTRCQA